MQEEDVTDSEKSGVISGVLDSIFTESDDVTMRSNRQLSDGGNEGQMEIQAEMDRSSVTEELESKPKIESLADIESITDGRVVLKGGKSLETKNENGRINIKTGDFSEDAEETNEQGEDAETQKENSENEKDSKENKIEKKNSRKTTQDNKEKDSTELSTFC